MGLGPTILSLYHQLKLLGAFDEIDSVIELGSQGVWCPDRRLLVGLFEAFGRPVPPEHRAKYGMTTNHGTTEHLLNQYNAFKMIHDFTAPGGLMLHALPFTVHLEHGFFNYQPNLFEALARFNSYKTLGVWVGPDWTLSSLVPWEPRLLEFLTLNAKTTH